MNRRLFCASSLFLLTRRARAADYPQVAPGTQIVFPRDHGSHPAFRTEWWYATGWVRDASGNDYGIQITFFRNRPGVAEGNPSRFAPTELLFAHAAIADARHGRLRHDQRVARAGFGLAAASEATTDVRIGTWSLVLDDKTYRARMMAAGFGCDLRLAATEPVLLQGDAGFSRKGPNPLQASFYYSQPQLAVSGAWFDHEWSSEVMSAQAAGWDWVGVNLDDGGALMAFRMRDRVGAALWAGGALRMPGGKSRPFAPGDVGFTVQRRWRSPRTQVEYPVVMTVDAGGFDFSLEPLMDDQELDSRASTGAIYWEGAVRALRQGTEVGRGYLELTGYGKPVRV